MKSCRLGDLKMIDSFDELFIKPTVEMMPYHGDDFVEVYDYSINGDWVDTAYGQVETTWDTVIYYR